MDSPQPESQVSMASVLEVQRTTIDRLMSDNIMLQAALADKDKLIKHLRGEE